jgi:hypothetical protein
MPVGEDDPDAACSGATSAWSGLNCRLGRDRLALVPEGFPSMDAVDRVE